MTNQRQQLHKRLDANINTRFRMTLINQILGLLENEEITPITAGLHLERQGIKPPFTLRKMIEAELRHREPDDAGIQIQDSPDAEEFEKAARAYYAKLKADAKAKHEERMERIVRGIKDE